MRSEEGEVGEEVIEKTEAEVEEVVIEGAEESRVIIGGAETMIEVEEGTKIAREGVETVIEEARKLVIEVEKVVIEVVEEVVIEGAKVVIEETIEGGEGGIMSQEEGRGAREKIKEKRHR